MLWVNSKFCKSSTLRSNPSPTKFFIARTTGMSPSSQRLATLLKMLKQSCEINPARIIFESPLFVSVTSDAAVGAEFCQLEKNWNNCPEYRTWHIFFVVAARWTKCTAVAFNPRRTVVKMKGTGLQAFVSKLMSKDVPPMQSSCNYV